MEFFKSVFAFFDRSASAFAVLIPLLTIAASYWRSIKDRHSEISKTRHTSLISPLFDLVEPYMLRNGKCATLDICAIQNLIKQNSHFCGGNLRRYLYDFSEKEDGDYFCKLISKEYDQSCKKLGIPLRSQRYRLRMYRPRFCVFQFIAYIVMNSMLFFVVMLFLLSLANLAVSSLTDTTFILAIPFILMIFLSMLDRMTSHK